VLSPNKISSIRKRLALRLSVVSTAALFAFSAVFFFLGGGLYFLMSRAWSAVLRGDPNYAGAFAVGGVMVALVMVYLIAIAWASWPTPRGVRLPRKAAPEFYNVMDILARQMGTRPVERVWINGDMNAVLMQRPSFGWCGPIETHLIVGLPLVHCLSATQFTAVLAHELAHLSEQRSGKDAYLAHLRAWWAKVLDCMHETVPCTEFLFQNGVYRYYRDMLRLARVEEFEADSKAAEIVGPELVAEALIEMSLKGRFLQQQYWPSVFAESLASPNCSVRPYRQMGLGVAVGFLRRESVIQDLSQYEAGGGALPFHPTLKERIAALGVQVEMPSDGSLSAAEHFFEDLLPTISWALDNEWEADADGSVDALRSSYLHELARDRLGPYEWRSLRATTTPRSDGYTSPSTQGRRSE